MKAIVYSEYGPPDVLKRQDVPKPAPQARELLIKVYATPVSYGDLIARKFNTITPSTFTMPALFWLPARLAFGWNVPKKQILGSEFAGVVAEVGDGVTCFKKGDAVFGYRSDSFGAYADYLTMAEDGMVALKPDNMRFEEAAAVPYGALTALSLLRKSGLQSGQRILIHGASGGIGSAAVQLAKNHFGAHVTGVCSTSKVSLVRALGADKVIDYTQEDFTAQDEQHDLIFDVLGKGSFRQAKKVLRENGRYLYVSFKMKQLLQMASTSVWGSQKVICALSLEKPEDLVLIRELVEAGKIKSIVDRCFPLEQAAEAHRYIEQGHKKGNVILWVGEA